MPVKITSITKELDAAIKAAALDLRDAHGEIDRRRNRVGTNLRVWMPILAGAQTRAAIAAPADPPPPSRAPHGFRAWGNDKFTSETTFQKYKELWKEWNLSVIALWHKEASESKRVSKAIHALTEDNALCRRESLSDAIEYAAKLRAAHTSMVSIRSVLKRACDLGIAQVESVVTGDIITRTNSVVEQIKQDKAWVEYEAKVKTSISMEDN